jgi:hypothetical protein
MKRVFAREASAKVLLGRDRRVRSLLPVSVPETRGQKRSSSPASARSPSRRCCDRSAARSGPLLATIRLFDGEELDYLVQLQTAVNVRTHNPDGFGRKKISAWDGRIACFPSPRWRSYSFMNLAALRSTLAAARSTHSSMLLLSKRACIAIGSPSPPVLNRAGAHRSLREYVP